MGSKAAAAFIEAFTPAFAAARESKLRNDLAERSKAFYERQLRMQEENFAQEKQARAQFAGILAQASGMPPETYTHLGVSDMANLMEYYTKKQAEQDERARQGKMVQDLARMQGVAIPEGVDPGAALEYLGQQSARANMQFQASLYNRGGGGGQDRTLPTSQVDEIISLLDITPQQRLSIVRAYNSRDPQQIEQADQIINSAKPLPMGKPTDYGNIAGDINNAFKIAQPAFFGAQVDPLAKKLQDAVVGRILVANPDIAREVSAQDQAAAPQTAPDPNAPPPLRPMSPTPGSRFLEKRNQGFYGPVAPQK